MYQLPEAPALCQLQHSAAVRWGQAGSQHCGDVWVPPNEAQHLHFPASKQNNEGGSLCSKPKYHSAAS